MNAHHVVWYAIPLGNESISSFRASFITHLIYTSHKQSLWHCLLRCDASHRGLLHRLGPCLCTVSSKLLKNSDDFKLFSLSTASAYHQKADQDRTTHAYTIGQEMTVSKSMVKPPLINVGMKKAKLSLKGILNQWHLNCLCWESLPEIKNTKQYASKDFTALWFSEQSK